MPLNYIKELFQPRQPAQYDPNREAMFAQLLARGQQPVDNWGSLVGNLAQSFVGSRGLKRQGEARRMEEQAMQRQQQQGLADMLGGLGVNVPPGQEEILASNPNILKEYIEQAKPPEQTAAQEPKTAKGADGYLYWVTGPNAGQRALPGVEAPEPAAPAPKQFDKPRKYTNEGGEERWITDSAQRDQAFAEGFAPFEATAQAAGQEAPSFSTVQSLRKEFSQLSGGFKKRQEGYRTVKTAGERGTAVSDHALIFAYMKTQDPDSVVRESEFEIAQALGSFPQRIAASAQQLLNGERLTEEQRKDLVETSKEIYGEAVEEQKRLRSQYEDIAKSYGMKPTQALINFIDEALSAQEQQQVPLEEQTDDELRAELARLGG